ncbi:hypothetical protein [Cedecea neteri]|uniref:hypothetical protein n=1 Tax=Cedecea neteri TaxID=158822 RepID=UPI00289F837F|nr:hypothetical protein [Cedecea neteri]
MAKVILVWNPQKTECVGFVERDANSSDWDCGSDGDAEHAAGGERCNPVSSLADNFREQYEDSDELCYSQVVDVDIELAASVSRDSEW